MWSSEDMRVPSSLTANELVRAGLTEGLIAAAPRGAERRGGAGDVAAMLDRKRLGGGGAERMGSENSLHAVQTIFLLLLVIVAFFAAMARRLNVPYPILLVLAGVVISFVPHVPRVPLNPELIFLVFLPPLLYAAAWQTSWREFKRNLVSIAMLAIGLVGFTVWGIAEIADRFITALDWKSGFVLGAVVATTDAIAATSIAKSVGLPKQIVDVLEGESLLNDATGLLALEFGLTMLLRGDTPSVTGGLLRLLWLIAGGLGAGLIVGVVTAWFERWIDDGPVELVISLITPYAAYLAGEGLKASGILSVVACGLYLSRRSPELFSPEVRLQITSSWSGLNFMLNGIVFVLIGLQLPYVLAGIRGYSVLTLVGYGAAFSAVLIVLRLFWIFPGAEVAYQIRTKLLRQTFHRAAPRAVFVVGWTGMRGVVALAAAISLPERLGDGRPFAQRNLIVFLTFSVIFVTLVVQGLSLPAVIRLLGLAGQGTEGDEETEARRTVLEAAIAHVESLRSRDDGRHEHEYHDLLHRYRDRLKEVSFAGAGSTQAEHLSASDLPRRSIALDAMQIERRTLIQLRDDGKIGDDVLRRLERELDLTEARQRSREVG